MPNPLSRVHPNPTVKFVPFDLLSHKLAPHIASCIAAWSITEATLGRFLVTIMGAQARPTLAMFGALQSNAAKMAVVTAAASAIVNPIDLEAFEAMLPLLRRAASQRHKLAHHIWGTCPEVPSGLLLADPKDSILHSITVSEALLDHVKAGTLGAQDMALPSYPTDKVMVWKHWDFERCFRETALVGKWLNFLCLVVDPVIGGERARRLLETEPEFQKALSQLRQRQNNRAAPIQSPNEEPPGEK